MANSERDQPLSDKPREPREENRDLVAYLYGYANSGEAGKDVLAKVRRAADLLTLYLDHRCARSAGTRIADGWKLVPERPNGPMLMAACRVLDPAGNVMWDGIKEAAKRYYNAMVDAAPTPPSSLQSASEAFRPSAAAVAKAREYMDEPEERNRVKANLGRMGRMVNGKTEEGELLSSIIDDGEVLAREILRLDRATNSPSDSRSHK